MLSDSNSSAETSLVQEDLSFCQERHRMLEAEQQALDALSTTVSTRRRKARPHQQHVHAQRRRLTGVLLQDIQAELRSLSRREAGIVEDAKQLILQLP